MTVIVIEEERGFHKEAPCALCGGELKVPFVVYSHGPAACFCSECCTTLRRGLMADMVQVAAIVEMGFTGSTTLVRCNIDDLKRAGVGVNPEMAFASSVVRMVRKVK
jgi:hypothetical protein